MKANFIVTTKGRQIEGGFIGILLFLLSCSPTKVNHDAWSKMDFEIDFQDGFRSDTLSIKLGGCPIFTHKILNSDKTLGYTGLKISAIKSQGETQIRYSGNNLKCENFGHQIEIDLHINSKVMILNVDILKGKFIGIGKLANDSLEISQSDRKFYYY